MCKFFQVQLNPTTAELADYLINGTSSIPDFLKPEVGGMISGIYRVIDGQLYRLIPGVSITEIK